MNDCEVENSGDFFGNDDLDEKIEEMFAALEVGVSDDNENEYEENQIDELNRDNLVLKQPETIRNIQWYLGFKIIYIKVWAV